MKSYIHLLQIDLYFRDYKFALLCFLTAFVVTLITIPPIIHLVRKYRLYDVPDHRKEHSIPIPTMGGIAIIAGMMAALIFWFPFSGDASIVTFFLSVVVLFSMGIMDDIKDLSAKYKFMIEIVLAILITVSGIRITSFNGLFGIHELPITAQYTFTIIAIVGVTNAFNLLDGIDGLAGGLGFMSLVMLGIFLIFSEEPTMALIAFAMAGALLAFLYFNFNPARIFMGDTGSLVLGFVISVLCIKLIQANNGPGKILAHAPVFALGIVLIPVFDTLRVFAERIWKGKSPFDADRSHIHHLLTNAGYSHQFAVKLICFVHALILIEVYWLKELRQEFILALLFLGVAVATIVFKNLGLLRKKYPAKTNYEQLKLRA
jgi:UDP-GlcNAc:undecaprenyl-phosphate/decaprenyl-phosphate GlcNAc-1-phosphate transferase